MRSLSWGLAYNRTGPGLGRSRLMIWLDLKWIIQKYLILEK